MVLISTSASHRFEERGSNSAPLQSRPPGVARGGAADDVRRVPGRLRPLVRRGQGQKVTAGCGHSVGLASVFGKFFVVVVCLFVCLCAALICLSVRFLTSFSLLLSWCFTTTETVWLIKDRGRDEMVGGRAAGRVPMSNSSQ